MFHKLGSIETRPYGSRTGINGPFPTAAIDNIDPFLLLDEICPVDYGPGEAIGAPDRPHRGSIPAAGSGVTRS